MVRDKSHDVAANRRVTCDRRGRVAWIALPPAANGRLSRTSARDLCEHAADVALDPAVSVVVLSARGRDFCLGFEDGADDCVGAIASLPQPVVAVLRGRALAEGCELALACDLRLGASTATFALSQVREGRMPRLGGTQRLARLVGPTRALEILWTGRPVRAPEALRIGLVSRLVSPRQLQRETDRCVGLLEDKAPLALRYAKEAVRSAFDLELEQGMRLEEDLYVLLQTTADRVEGVRAFRRRRKPRFTGR